MWAKAEHDIPRVLHQQESLLVSPSKSLSSLSRLGAPLSRGQQSPPTPTPVGEMCPRSSGFTLGGGRGPLFSILLLRPSSLPPHSVSAPRLLERLQLAEGPLQPPPVGSEFPLWGVFRDPLSPTRTPAVPLPERASPGPSLSHPLYRGAPGEPREQTQQIAERESAEPAPSARRPPPRPVPVAQTPALRARLSRPFRCSSQDRGRRAASSRGSPGPRQSTSLPEDLRRKLGGGRHGPAPACTPGAEKTRSPRTQPAPSPAGCGGASGRRGGPDTI